LDSLGSLPRLVADSSTSRKFYIEFRTPGLNDKIEQAAIVSKELLFQLARVVMPSLLGQFGSVKLMFPSSGDAAGFQAYCRRQGISIPEAVVLTDISLDRVSADDTCLVLIGARNNVGDPVLRTVKSITDTYASAVCILLNCDFSDRVTTGMTDRTMRDTYRATFKPLFYFRNLVAIMRPSQIPLERGVLIYTPSDSWSLFAVDDSRIEGPGSLNRFMRTAAFLRAPSDPTARSPPEFMLAANFADMPKRDEIDDELTRASTRFEKELARRAIARRYNSRVDALALLSSCAATRRFDGGGNVEAALRYLLANPQTQKAKPAPAASEAATAGMGFVAFDTSEPRVASEPIAASGVNLASPELHLGWSDLDIKALGGRWSLLHCIGSSSLGRELEVSGCSLIASGRPGELSLVQDTLHLRMSLQAQTFLGLQLAGPVTDCLELAHIDETLLVVREQAADAVSVWGRERR
jgi:hypothetical protein